MPPWAPRPGRPSSFAHGDKSVRMAAARLASVIRPDGDARIRGGSGRRTGSGPDHGDPRIDLERARRCVPRAGGRWPAWTSFHGWTTDAERRDAVRLLVFALGDWHLDKPPLEIHSMCSLPDRFRPQGEHALKIIDLLRRRFPSGDAALDLELSRVLAMLEAPAEDSADLFVARIGPATSVSDDIHYLIVLSRLTGPLTPAAKDRIADAILSLSAKAGGLDGRPKQVWGDRLEELVRALLAKHPDLGARLLAHRGFVSPPHVGFAACLAGDERREAASRFLEPALERKDWPWSEALIDLSRRFPGTDSARRSGNDGTKRSRCAMRSPSTSPGAPSRRTGPPPRGSRLGEPPGRVRMPRGHSRRCLPTAPRRGSRRSSASGRGFSGRRATRSSCARRSGPHARVRPRDRRGGGPGPRGGSREGARPPRGGPPRAEGSPRLSGRGPRGAPRHAREGPLGRWRAPRGETVFRKRCETCHAVQGALGPSLAGVAARFSRNDLFTAIADPARDVAPAFRPTLFRLADGGAVSGVVVFESADGTWCRRTRRRR